MVDKEQLLKITVFGKYSSYNWKEITIGCSDTQVFEISSDNEVLFLKLGKAGVLTSEYENLSLLGKYISVPKVVMYKLYDGYEYLLTEKMAGTMSCDDEHIDNEQQTLEVMVEAINMIQKVKLDNNLKQKFANHYIEDELKLIKEKIDTKELVELPKKPVFSRFNNIDEMYNYLLNNKPNGELIFSHGDVSMPNVFINNGKLSGFIDIGNAGIRQAWYDIADAYVSVRRNFESQEVADKFLQMLGVMDKSPVEYYEMLIVLS